MDIRALRYFIEVARLQSFTAAADKLCVTQPTISKMIRKLEDETGGQLLDRQNYRLTDLGQVVFERGQEVLRAQAGLETGLKETRGLARGQLAIGIPPICGMLFIRQITAYKQRYPGIELVLLEEGANAIQSAMRQGEIELGGLLLPLDGSEFEYESLTDDVLVLVSRIGSAWQGRQAVGLAELAAEPFILFRSSFALNERVLAACRDCGFAPQIVSRSGQWEFIAAMVEAGLGIALLPASVARRIAPDQCAITPLVNPEIGWNVVLAWRHEATLSLAAKAWIEMSRALKIKSA